MFPLEWFWVKGPGEWLYWIRHKIHLSVNPEKSQNVSQVLSLAVCVTSALRTQPQHNVTHSGTLIAALLWLPATSHLPLLRRGTCLGEHDWHCAASPTTTVLGPFLSSWMLLVCFHNAQELERQYKTEALVCCISTSLDGEHFSIPNRSYAEAYCCLLRFITCAHS